MSLSVTPAQTAAWRRQIFEQLSERTKREMDNFRHYEQAIEQVKEKLQPGTSVLYLFGVFPFLRLTCVVTFVNLDLYSFA